MGGVIVLDGFRRSFGFPLLVQGVEDNASTSAQLAWLVSIFPLCCACTAIIAGTLADRLSRRYTVLLGAVIFTVGGALQALADSTTTLLAGRVLGGLAVGILSCVVPIYNAELSPPHLRGVLSTLFQLAITIGILVAFSFNLLTRVIGSEDGWRWSLGMQSVLSVVLVLGIGFLPESPRWFMKEKREDEARTVLRRLRIITPVQQQQQPEPEEAQEEQKADGKVEKTAGKTAASASGSDSMADAFLRPRPVHDSVDEEIEGIRASILEEAQAGEAGWADLLSPPMRLRMLFGCGIQACQQLTFINAVMYYSTIIASAVGINPLAATAVIGLVNVVLTVMTISYVDRVGRIPLLLLGSVGMLAAALLVACTVYLSSPASSAAGLLTVLLICCHVGCFAFSFGPLGWVIPSEIMPLALRGRAVSVTTTVNWLGSFAVGEMVPSMLSAWGVGGTFYVIAVGLAVGLLFVLLIGRETKGVSLEQMERLLRVEGKDAWTQYCRENWNRGLVLLRIRNPSHTG